MIHPHIGEFKAEERISYYAFFCGFRFL